MLNILQFLLLVGLTYIGFMCYKKLVIIARETETKEELRDAIDKFAALAGEKKTKVVAFRAKNKEEDG